jgi:hypothetical protein
MHYSFLGHKIMSTLFFTVGSTNSNSHSLFSTEEANKDAICLCGSADVEMIDGSIKSPDYSMYEVAPKICIMAGWPTVIWEVAYSQDEKKLALKDISLVLQGWSD